MLLHYAELPPGPLLAPYIFCFWKTRNPSPVGHSYLVLPDGGIELVLTLVPGRPPAATLYGLATRPATVELPAGAVLLGIRCKLPAVEFLLRTTLVPDTTYPWPAAWWGTVSAATPITDFAATSRTHWEPLVAALTVDPRKQRLFEQLYAAQGAIGVQALAQTAGWEARQVNRYFTTTFGLPLKPYLQQLTFAAALTHLRQGQRHPPLAYYDQSHFIRHVRQHTGQTPTPIVRATRHSLRTSSQYGAWRIATNPSRSRWRQQEPLMPPTRRAAR